MAEHRAWLSGTIVVTCVGAALALVACFSATAGQIPARPLLIVLLAGLTIVAVGTSLFGPMELDRASLALRLVILVPIALSIALVVALMLDTDFRVRAETLRVGG